MSGFTDGAEYAFLMMLPEGEQDDLQAIQLYMNKGQDGIFNAGDYILFYGSGPVTWKYNSIGSVYSFMT